MKKTQASGKNRRGSPEAIAKRRAARAFNDLLDPSGPKFDGRTEKRRQRLLSELERGATRSGRPLKPLEILSHVDELLRLGETPQSLKRLKKPARRQAASDELVKVLAELQAAYGFSPEAYAFLGIDEKALRRAKIVKRQPAASRRTAASKPSARRKSPTLAKERSSR